MKSLIHIVILIALTSCNQNKSDNVFTEKTTDITITKDSASNNTSDSIQTQTDINKTCYNEYVATKESVEKEFIKLLKALPQYSKELKKEKKIWEKYQKAVQEVSECEDHGSSTPMYASAVLSQGIQIRGVPQHCLYLHTQGKEILHSKATFTPSLIAEAYTAYIEAVEEDEYNENKTQYAESLRKEQECWNDLVKCRTEISHILTGNLKGAFDIGTNQMFRTKLYQLKNQNRTLGLTNEEIIRCALPENCSDRDLLEYPGFGIAWKNHLNNPK